MDKPNPLLSMVVIAHKMSRQALNTVYSLSSRHQKNLPPGDHEIIVVENHSSDPIDSHQLQAIDSNITHIYRHETSQSPARAINIGLEACRGQFVGLMIDGARMVTPRVLEYALFALHSHPDPLIAVPSYNLGRVQHHLHKSMAYGELEEMNLLQAVRWKENGYRLFDIASIGDANANGFMSPLLESNCFFSTRSNFTAIGGANEAFDLPGGGSLNLHMFRQLGMLPGIRYFLLPGEGTFHQFHGGITTSEADDREEVLRSHKKQLHSYWPGGFHSLRKEPILLGSVTSHALRYLRYSSRRAKKRSVRLRKSGFPLWPDNQ